MKRDKRFWKRLNKYERSYLVRYERANKIYHTFMENRLCPMCEYPMSCPPRCDCLKEYDRIIAKAKGKIK